MGTRKKYQAFQVYLHGKEDTELINELHAQGYKVSTLALGLLRRFAAGEIKALGKKHTPSSQELPVIANGI